MPKLRIQDNAPRLYQAGGVSVPSVTEVLKVAEGNWMNAWLQKVGRREVDRVMNEAAVLGTRVHALAERVAVERNYEPEPEMAPFADAIREFLNIHTRRVIGTEISLASARLGFGGTCDLYAEMADGSLAVVDFKTSAGGLTRLNGLQLSGYALLLKESGRTVNRRVCVRVHKAPEKLGKWYARGYPNHREDTEAFLAARTLWWFLHGAKARSEKSA